jgi:hypothetical protein
LTEYDIVLIDNGLYRSTLRDNSIDSIVSHKNEISYSSDDQGMFFNAITSNDKKLTPPTPTTSGPTVMNGFSSTANIKGGVRWRDFRTNNDGNWEVAVGKNIGSAPATDYTTTNFSNQWNVGSTNPISLEYDPTAGTLVAITQRNGGIDTTTRNIGDLGTVNYLQWFQRGDGINPNSPGTDQTVSFNNVQLEVGGTTYYLGDFSVTETSATHFIDFDLTAGFTISGDLIFDPVARNAEGGKLEISLGEECEPLTVMNGSLSTANIKGGVRWRDFRTSNDGNWEVAVGNNIGSAPATDYTTTNFSNQWNLGSANPISLEYDPTAGTLVAITQRNGGIDTTTRNIGNLGTVNYLQWLQRGDGINPNSPDTDQTVSFNNVRLQVGGTTYCLGDFSVTETSATRFIDFDLTAGFTISGDLIFDPVARNAEGGKLEISLGEEPCDPDEICGNGIDDNCDGNIDDEDAAGYCCNFGLSTVNSYIKRINFFTLQSGMSNFSGDDGGYGDYTDSVFHVDDQGGFFIRFIPENNNPGELLYWQVWVDLNKDTTFTASERLLFNATNVPFTGTIPLPPWFEGATRVRISMSSTFYQAQCGSFELGEVEDYTIHCGTPDPCPDVLVIDGEDVQGEYQARNKIITTGPVNIIGNTSFRAKEFDIGHQTTQEPGVSFETLNDPCN